VKSKALAAGPLRVGGFFRKGYDMEFRGIKYSPQTGLAWITNRKTKKTKLVMQKNRPYFRIYYEGKEYMLHRVIWEIMTGNPIPEGLCIDHINGNRHDNRWCNLRLSDVRRNGQNRKEHREGMMVGTLYRKNKDIWETYIQTDNKQIYIGSSKTELGAHYRYMDYLDENNIPYEKEIDKRSKGENPNNPLLKWNRVTVKLNGEDINLTMACRKIGVTYGSLKNRRKKTGWDNQRLIDFYANECKLHKGYRNK